LVVTAWAIHALWVTARVALAHCGEIFTVWDEVTSWNRWALEWAGNQWPARTMGYPQLLPANFSLTYVFMGSDHLWMFARALMPLFSLALLLLPLDLALRTRRWGFVLAIPLTAILLKTILADTQYVGYADGPLAFLAAVGFYVCILDFPDVSADSSTRPSRALLIPILAATATLITIQGWFVWLALLFLVWCWRTTSAKPRRRWLAWLGVTLLCVAPWHTVAVLRLDLFSTRGINLWEVLCHAHHGRDVWERMIHGVHQLVVAGGLPGVFCVTLSCVAWFSRRWRWPALLGGLWLLLWSVGLSYDTRNLAPVLAFLGLSTAMGLVEVFHHLTRVRIALILTALLLAVAATNPEDKLIVSQTGQQERLGDTGVNRVLWQYLDTQELDGKILSNYNFLPFVPRLAPYYVHECFYDFAKFKQQLADTRACYLLVGTPWCDPAVRDFIQQKLKSGGYSLLTEFGRWQFIRTDAPRRVDCWLAAATLDHKIGHAAWDLAAIHPGVWMLERDDRLNFALYGHYVNLPAGRYRVSFRVRAAGLKPGFPVTFDVTEERGRITRGKLLLDRPTRGYEWLSLDVTLTGAGDVEFRCWKAGGGRVALDAIHYWQLD
jgi:hypothetical protein